MNYMASLSDTAFTLCVKHTATLAKTLNDQVREVEAELSIALSND